MAMISPSLILAACVLLDGREPPTVLNQSPSEPEGVPASLSDARETTRTVVSHLDQPQGDWLIAETEHFRIYHQQSRAFVERIARVAEATRGQMQRRWLGANEPWSERCEIYLHHEVPAQGEGAGFGVQSRGYSQFFFREGRVAQRMICLRANDADMLQAVLPHEITHAVLAGHFGDQAVPRWADEGIAVLSEPAPYIARHLRRVPADSDERFPLRVLLEMDYPSLTRIDVFYAQSVSVVEFLAHRKGSQVFTQFVQYAMRSGYAPALKRYYGFDDFDQLEADWSASMRAAARHTGRGTSRTQSGELRTLHPSIANRAGSNIATRAGVCPPTSRRPFVVGDPIRHSKALCLGRSLQSEWTLLRRSRLLLFRHHS